MSIPPLGSVRSWSMPKRSLPHRWHLSYGALSSVRSWCQRWRPTRQRSAPIMARACARAVPGSSQSYPLIGPSVTVERSVAGSDRSLPAAERGTRVGTYGLRTSSGCQRAVSWLSYLADVVAVHPPPTGHLSRSVGEVLHQPTSHPSNDAGSVWSCRPPGGSGEVPVKRESEPIHHDRSSGVPGSGPDLLRSCDSGRTHAPGGRHSPCRARVGAGPDANRLGHPSRVTGTATARVRPGYSPAVLVELDARLLSGSGCSARTCRT